MWKLCNNYDKKNWFTWSPMTSYTGQQSADMAWRLFSTFFGISIRSFFKLWCLQRVEFGLQSDPICLTHRLLLWKPFFSMISFSKNLVYNYLIRLLNKRQFSDARTRPAMHQANLCKGAWDLKLWMNWWRLLANALIVHLNISLNCWNSTTMCL